MILEHDIVTGRLILRTLTSADASTEYLAWMHDPRVNRYLESRFSSFSLESLAQFIASCNENPKVLLVGITLKDGGRHIGNIKLGPIDPNHRLSDIGLLIGDPDAWGRGYAREAIAGLSEHALRVLGLHKLTASFYEANIGSEKAFLGAGWAIEGMRPRQFLSNGEWQGCRQVSLIADEEKVHD